MHDCNPPDWFDTALIPILIEMGNNPYIDDLSVAQRYAHHFLEKGSPKPSYEDVFAVPTPKPPPIIHYAVLEELVPDLDQFVAVIKGLIIAEYHFRYGERGSVSTTYPLTRRLSERDYAGYNEYFAWAVRHSCSMYVPYGRRHIAPISRGRKAILDLLDRNGREARLDDSIGHPVPFRPKYLAYMRDIRDKNEARLRAIYQAERDKIIEEKNERSQKRALLRKEIKRQGSKMTPQHRIQLLLAYSNVPVAIFPKEWASVDYAALKTIDPATRGSLMTRLTGSAKPWDTLRRRLVAIEELRVS